MSVLFIKWLVVDFIITLVVANTEKSALFFEKTLLSLNYNNIIFAKNFQESSDLILNHTFDTIIININNENLDSFLKFASKNTDCHIILTVPSENFNILYSNYSNLGIVFLEKPLNLKSLRLCLLTLAQTSVRFNHLKLSNISLTREIDDIKIIDRAKCILISTIKMDEKSAHKYIEQQSMKLRKTKRQIALNILKTYEN